MSTRAFVQDVSAQGTYTTGGRTPVTLVGDANANITNTGTVNIHADAYATANDAGLAIAEGGIDFGVRQEVDSNGGNASATIDNGGTLNITALASAHAATGTAHLTTGGWWSGTSVVPGAHAYVNQGISQDVGAHALATGSDTHGPGATAYTTAAQAGNALASLTNGGTINIEAVANATAYNTAFAAAYVGGGIHQRRDGRRRDSWLRHRHGQLRRQCDGLYDQRGRRRDQRRRQRPCGRRHQRRHRHRLGNRQHGNRPDGDRRRRQLARQPDE